MTPLEKVATVALFAAFLVACFRARWVALAIAPPALLTIAAITGLVDISSASHPLRIATAILGVSLAMWAAWWYVRERRRWIEARARIDVLFGPKPIDWWIVQRTRALVASILVFASDCTDVPALFTWQIPGEFVVVPLQIAVCVLVAYVLVAPERWLPWTR